MALCGLAATFSCSDSDDPNAENPLASAISGKTWWADYHQDGEYAWSQENVEPYSRIIETYTFNSDGTGVWNRFYLNADESEPFALSGGKNHDAFHYTSTADGLITVTIDEKVTSIDPFPQTWTMKYGDSSISFTDTKGQLQQTREASEAELLLSQEWVFNIDGGAAMEYYNINDKDFTRSNWRKQEAIYIYDGKGVDKRDEKGRTGYTLVALPWYKGDKVTNLPEGFCDDITPQNGWEWVLNRCGSRPTKNNNYFAVYNKYTGTLRFFYYMPEGFSTGNDHVWQVSMSNNLALNSRFLYAVPNDLNIVDKAAINQTGNGFLLYVTPWVNYRSKDNLIVPNMGWWAFDVDLSCTRPNFDLTKESIRLQMRSWKDQHVSLTSAIKANIEGTMEGSIRLEDFAEPISSSNASGLISGVECFADLVSLPINISKGETVGAIGSGVSLFKNIISLLGIPTEPEAITGQEGNFKGTINLSLNGKMDTEGLITSAEPTVGVVSPTFSIADFDLKNSHIGQGVWNLKSAPVVYLTNELSADYLGSSDWHSEGYYTYFFDPTSVEVELNSKIFPKDQIEWMEVEAVCGVRAANKGDELQKYRRAQGLTDVSFSFLDFYLPETVEGMVREYGNLQESNPLTDYFYAHSDKKGLNDLGTIFSHTFGQIFGQIFNQTAEDYNIVSYIGRGTKDYLVLEPIILRHNPCIYSLPPSLEVNVTLYIKLKSMKSPLCYNRQYLPNIKTFDMRWDMNAHWNRIKNYKLDAKQKDHREDFDYQVNRIHDIFKILLPDYETIQPVVKRTYTVIDGTKNAEKIFDGKVLSHENGNYEYSLNHYWVFDDEDKKDGKWFVEFKCNEGAFKPTTYTFWSTPDPDFVFHPENWILYGKKGKNDQWKVLDDHSHDNVSREAPYYPYRAYTIQNPAECQYFRLEVMGDYSRSIGELMLNN